MSLYAIGTKVWVKPFDCLGEVTEAHYGYPGHPARKRHATYVVHLREPKNNPDARGRMEVYRDYMLGSDGLRRADAQCDGCNRWLSESSFNQGSEARNSWDDVVEARFCFLCTREHYDDHRDVYSGGF